jgi:hypothetical protein
VVIEIEPLLKTLLKLLEVLRLECAIKLLLVALMRALHLPVELRLAGFNENVLDVMLMTGSGEGMDLYRLVRGCFRSSCIPIGEGGVIVSLNRADGKGHPLDDLSKKSLLFELHVCG